MELGKVFQISLFLIEQEGLSPDWAISLILFGLVFLSFGGVGHLAFDTAINASNFGVRKISFWGTTVVDSFENS